LATGTEEHWMGKKFLDNIIVWKHFLAKQTGKKLTKEHTRQLRRDSLTGKIEENHGSTDPRIREIPNQVDETPMGNNDLIHSAHTSKRY
jgi:hypothetical protein